MTSSHEVHINQTGEAVSILDTADGYNVWNHEQGEHYGTAGDPESARLMIDG